MCPVEDQSLVVFVLPTCSGSGVLGSNRDAVATAAVAAASTVPPLTAETEPWIVLPSSLSLPQVEFVPNLVSHAKEIQVELKWFFPVFSIILKRKPAKPVSKRSPSVPPPGLASIRRRSAAPLGPFTVYVNFPPNLRDAFHKFALMETRRASPFAQRPSEPFQANFNIITTINTEPLVPAKFAPQVGLASLLLGQQGGGMVGGGRVQHPLGPGTSYLQPIGGAGDGGGGGQFEVSEADQLLLEQLSGVDRIYVVSGKVDQLDLALLLNNEAFLEQKPCRIIYLVSMSILTLWMALKVKVLCGDCHWNSSANQITLESKSSPNNNIIFFELSTFMRALNIDTSLVTHHIVDIDSLRHLLLIIFGHDPKQARALYDYFAPGIVNLVDWMDCHEHVIPAMLGGEQTGHVEPVNVVHLYLVDSGHYLSPKGESLDSGTNPELERLLPRVLHANSNISPSVMIEFISTFPVMINYKCHYLNGLTPLIVTVLGGTVDQLYSILAAGANAHLASWNDTTPIEWAIQAKREEQVPLLMVHLSATNISFDLNLKHHYANKFVNAPPNVGDLDAKIRQILVKKVQQSQPLYDVDYSVIIRLLGITSLAPNCEYPFTTFCLYPHLPNNELDIEVSLFNFVGGSHVRIILSTFTLDCLLQSDIRYLIKTGIHLSKVQSGFTSTSQYRLVPNQSSEKVSEYRYYRDLFDQSTGTPVYIYNLYSRSDVLNHQLVVGSEENDETDLGYAEPDSIYNCFIASKYFKLKSLNMFGYYFRILVLCGLLSLVNCNDNNTTYSSNRTFHDIPSPDRSNLWQTVLVVFIFLACIVYCIASVIVSYYCNNDEMLLHFPGGRNQSVEEDSRRVDGAQSGQEEHQRDTPPVSSTDEQAATLPSSETDHQLEQPLQEQTGFAPSTLTNQLDSEQPTTSGQNASGATEVDDDAMKKRKKKKKKKKVKKVKVSNQPKSPVNKMSKSPTKRSPSKSPQSPVKDRNQKRAASPSASPTRSTQPPHSPGQGTGVHNRIQSPGNGRPKKRQDSKVVRQPGHIPPSKKDKDKDQK